MKLAWMTDLHLDQTDPGVRSSFLKTLQNSTFDAALVTGDISNAERLPRDLVALANACGDRPLHFTLGNHDFHGSSFEKVDAAVAAVCRSQSNLCGLDYKGSVRLSDRTTLVGHRGWADGRAGWGSRTLVAPPDSHRIDDFRARGEGGVFELMANLGNASACCIRAKLPYALTCAEEVLVATHVPPFAECAYFGGRPCGPLHAPYFSNVAMGKAIRGICHHFPKKRVTVLCGHTHERVRHQVSAMLQVRVGGAHRGRPGIEAVFEA